MSITTNSKRKIYLMANWLAQLGKRWSAEWEMTGSNPRRINDQGL